MVLFTGRILHIDISASRHQMSTRPAAKNILIFKRRITKNLTFISHIMLLKISGDLYTCKIVQNTSKDRVITEETNAN